MIARRLARALALGMLVAGCAGAPPVAPRPDTGSCDPGDLAACERRLVASLGAKDAEAEGRLGADYAAARAARDPADPWAQAYRALAAARAPVVLLEAGASLEGKDPQGATVARVPALPSPGVPADTLLLALARAAGVPHVARVRGGEVTHLFAIDPLSPFTAGITPIARGDRGRVAADVRLAEAIRLAFADAGAARYVEAARRGAALAEAVAAGGSTAARGRLALQLLAAAGILLDGDNREGPPAPPVADTPYAAYVEVLSAKDPRAAWAARSEVILPGIAPDRRAGVAALHGGAKGCDDRRAPPMEGPRDLVFTSALAGALARDPAAPRPGEIPITAWLPRYEAAARLVEETHTAWAYLPALLRERGDGTGLGPEATAAYQRVTDLALAHIAGLRALAQAEPARYRGFASLGLALAPGLLGDPRLQKAMVDLTEVAARDRLAAASDPEEILAAVATGAIVALSFPPALSEAHLGAIQGAVTAKLRGEMRDRRGWGVAALFAADAAYRLLAGQSPDLDTAAGQIARALAGPGVEQPALAALASAAARYAALAAARRLDPGVTRVERLGADRPAARAALRAAIAGLGTPDEAPAKLLDDLTDLADGLAATLSAAAAGSAARRQAAPRVRCEEVPAVTLDARTRRALARLGDVRRRILAHPKLKQGQGTWARRARLLATLLSDAMDLAAAGDARRPAVFTVAPADAERAWIEALAGDAPPGVAPAAAGAYAIARTFAESPSAEAFFKRSGGDLQRLAGGLGALLGRDGPAMGAALLDAIGRAQPGTDAAAALATYADQLFAQGRRDEADLCLLASLVVSSVTRRPPPDEAVALADRRGSRVAWALRFTREIRGARPGSPPDPARYAAALRGATDDACQAPDADATLAVMNAIRDHAAGKRKEAREALDRVLDRADSRGLGVPRMVYRYDERTATKVFTVDVGISYGSGVLLQGNTFQLGLGVRGRGDPGGSLAASLAPPGSAQAAEDAARYYVYTAALATAYHLLDGDRDRAVAAGRRAIGALSSGLVLGPRRLTRDNPAAWGEDAREILIVAAELAAEAGLPFLAGDLWTVVRQGFAESLDDRAVAAMLDHLPLGLAGIAELSKPVDRARRSLAALAEPMACTAAKVELGAFEEVTCEAYPLALSLRAAGGLKKLPRLHRSAETSARCPAWRSLDAFLAGEQRGTYDPDAFTQAVAALQAEGKVDDAAVLLARRKRPNHCSPAIVAAARSLGRSTEIGPKLRADLLSSAVNCTALTGGREVQADVIALDEETRRLPDPRRNLDLLLSTADLAVRTDRWEVLSALVDRPDFVTRWLSVHPRAAAAAILIDHAAAVARGRPVDVDRTRPAFTLICEAFPSPDRREVCDQIAALRRPGDHAREAREAVRRLLVKR